MRRRAGLVQDIRRFFAERQYLEVDTPLLSPALIPESLITPFSTRFASPHHGSRTLFLVPSPEIWMKRLLAEGSGSIFQISHCFRNSEQIGHLHNPEFTMLEWYTVDADYHDSADHTEELLDFLTSAETPRTMRPPCRRMSMAEAFDGIAGIDLAACNDIEELRRQADRSGVSFQGERSWEELFNALFLQLVEPELPRDRPLVLSDYPSRIATLAKQIPDTPWSERWELYIDGVEVANCFTEEDDPERVSDFYSHQEASLGEPEAASRSDRAFREVFKKGFPHCSGVALGVDRLLMLMSGRRELGGVIFFPLSDILTSQDKNNHLIGFKGIDKEQR